MRISCTCSCGGACDPSGDRCCGRCRTPAPATALAAMASRVASVSVEAARRKKTKRAKKPPPARGRESLLDKVPTVDTDVLIDEPEYSCHIELDITATFEGTAQKQALIRKVKAELLSAVKSSMTSVARGLNLRSSGVSVRPLRLEVDVNDA